MWYCRKPGKDGFQEEKAPSDTAEDTGSIPASCPQSEQKKPALKAGF
jgi:hypothetical protein